MGGGAREGLGVLYRHDGSSLRCRWHKDAAVSPATVHGTSGIVYSGGHDAVTGPTGWGVESSPEGRYCGEWKDGKRHGHGTFMSEEVVINGTWAANVLAGPGVMEIKGGSSISGTLS